MFTEAAGNTAIYNQVNPAVSIWDNGNTQWDFNGNIYATSWDTAKTIYTERSTNTPIFVQPIPAAVWDLGDSRWDISGNVETTLWDI